MFTKTAEFYDLIYSFKDYQSKTEQLLKLLTPSHPPGSHLLDIACGTGQHLFFLKNYFQVDGLDLSEELLQAARARNPDVVFYHANMQDFQLTQQYDVITCLFSSIGYLLTLANLTAGIQTMVRHLKPGGTLVIEPWFTPETWQAGTVHAVLIDKHDLKIARVNTSFVDGRRSYFDLHYLIGTPQGTEHFVEQHELGLFHTEEMLEILNAASLETTYDPEGLTGRGLFVGRREQMG
jgi:ubiquinone/menaquinone biosynthesis C-methylase UbiE